MDIAGTIVIVLGVIGVVLFGNHRNTTDFDKESNLSLSLLKESESAPLSFSGTPPPTHCSIIVVWGRKEWIIYLIFLELATVTLFWFSTIVHSVCMARVTDERGDADRDVDIDGMLGSGGGRRGSAHAGGFKAFLAMVKRSHGHVRRFIKKTLEQWSQSRPDSTIRKAAGLSWSVVGGILAGQSLIFAKSGVKVSWCVAETHGG